MTSTNYNTDLLNVSFSKAGSLKTIPKLLHIHQKKLLKEGILLPTGLLDELESYMQRNVIADLKEVRGQKEINAFCHQCCKAHAKKLAEHYNLTKQATLNLLNIFKGNIGHEGYYLDREELYSLDTKNFSA